MTMDDSGDGDDDDDDDGDYGVDDDDDCFATSTTLLDVVRRWTMLCGIAVRCTTLSCACTT